MQFQVPQFIDIEDKVIGPFSLKQFLYLAGAAGISFIFFLLFTPIIALVIASPLVGLALALAFYKVNGRDFLFFLNSVSNHFLRPKLYTWSRVAQKPAKKQQKTAVEIDEKKAKEQLQSRKQLSIEKKLQKLAWQLDIMKTQQKE